MPKGILFNLNFYFMKKNGKLLLEQTIPQARVGK